ncbi:MAG: rhodanese-like domain-containing protein [Methylovulum sp.]|nr:rhodanese-like domain-containing protein [Methylovulum sp.]
MRIKSRHCQIGFSIGLFLWLVIAVAWAGPDNIQSVAPKEAAAMQSAKKATIIDVREDNEWQEQHIPDAIHIPLGQLNERLPELKGYKDSTVITQCRSGKRSAQALEVLKLAGFTQVYNLSGGLMAWTKDGLATE